MSARLITTIRLYCDACGTIRLHEFVRERTDLRGRRWEVYRCARCGRKREYAVT